MAVTIQEVIGSQFGKRFYPELSGVARSYNFYPMGRAKPEQGVVNLALGMGKTVVDGGVTWTYSPAYPKVDPPYRTVKELLKHSQTEFWAVNMGDPPDYDPINETEYMLLENLTVAESDQGLRYLASTYNPYSDRLIIGISSQGARVLNFAPLLVLEEFYCRLEGFEKSLPDYIWKGASGIFLLEGRSAPILLRDQRRSPGICRCS